MQLKKGVGDVSWCMLGDFDASHGREKRKGRSTGSNQGDKEMKEFNVFVDSMEIVDIPLVGRKFTWVRVGGNAMIRIDRIMVSIDSLHS